MRTETPLSNSEMKMLRYSLKSTILKRNKEVKLSLKPTSTHHHPKKVKKRRKTTSQSWSHTTNTKTSKRLD